MRPLRETSLKGRLSPGFVPDYPKGLGIICSSPRLGQNLAGHRGWGEGGTKSRRTWEPLSPPLLLLGPVPVELGRRRGQSRASVFV